jgi:hypothetical protein
MRNVDHYLDRSPMIVREPEGEVIAMILHHSDTPASRNIGDQGFNVCIEKH